MMLERSIRGEGLETRSDNLSRYGLTKQVRTGRGGEKRINTIKRLGAILPGWTVELLEVKEVGRNDSGQGIQTGGIITKKKPHLRRPQRRVPFDSGGAFRQGNGWLLRHSRGKQQPEPPRKAVRARGGGGGGGGAFFSGPRNERAAAERGHSRRNLRSNTRTIY